MWAIHVVYFYFYCFVGGQIVPILSKDSATWNELILCIWFCCVYRRTDTNWWTRFSQYCRYSMCSRNPWFHIECPWLHYMICNAIFEATASGVCFVIHVGRSLCRAATRPEHGMLYIDVSLRVCDSTCFLFVDSCLCITISYGPVGGYGTSRESRW
jgi:hypothetical protein